MANDLHIRRAAQAEAEAGHTQISRRGAWVLVTGFAVLVLAVPLWQVAGDVYAGAGPAELLQPFRELLAPLGRDTGRGAAPGRAWPKRLLDHNRRWLRAINRFEDDLEEESRAGRLIRPYVQAGLTGLLGAGTEQVYCGRDGWLFYRPGIDHLTGAGFLEPRVLARRQAGGNAWQPAVHADPRPALIDFQRQLQARGIALLVVPIPVKPMLHPEAFTGPREWTRPLHNASYDAFVRSLAAAGIPVFDSAPGLVELVEAGHPVFLATDTHWRPDAMQHVASRLAVWIRASRLLPERPDPGYTVHPLPVTGRGDMAAMLQLPAAQTLYPAESVALRQVVKGSGVWQADPEADVLLMGDSFCNIYSLEGMGWGESAGMAEQLSYELGRPLDRLIRNDDGAYATRELLARELARGRDVLAGKRLVIYSFAVRELSHGNWRPIALDREAPPAADFIDMAPGAVCRVRGVVAATAFVPRPGTVPYRDHVMSVHLVDVEGIDPVAGGQVLVYMPSMTNNVWTAAARLRPADRVVLRLEAWADVSARYGRLNRSELDDISVALQPPCWSERIGEQVNSNESD